MKQLFKTFSTRAKLNEYCTINQDLISDLFYHSYGDKHFAYVEVSIENELKLKEVE